MDYLEGVDARPVAPGPEAVAKLSALRGPLPPGPTSAETVLHLLNEYGSPATVANGGGRYFGFVNEMCIRDRCRLLRIGSKVWIFTRLPMNL